jgi:hypothetical protein
MEENPYEPPRAPRQSRRRSFWTKPTLLEWIVIVLVVLALLAAFVPQFPFDIDAPPPRPIPGGGL